MNRPTYIRIIIDIVMATSVIFGLWYVVLPLGIVAFWAFPYYLELILAGFVFDALFGFGKGWGVWGYAGIVATVVSAGVVYLMKKVLRR